MRGDAPLTLIWITLLGWANPADGKEKLRGQQVIVRRGQVATGVREISEEWQFGHSCVQRCLSYLEKTGRISTESGTDGTVITILNYDKYQRRREKTGTESGTRPAQDRHETGTPPVPSEQRNKRTREQENQGCAPAEPPPPEPVKKAQPVKAGTPPDRIGRGDDATDGAKVFAAYFDAYAAQYPAPTVFNQDQARWCKKLVQKLGVDDAIKVVQFYVKHTKQFYVERGHSLQWCVNDAESLRTQALANYQMTSTKARQVDQTASNLQNLTAAAERIAQRRAHS